MKTFFRTSPRPVATRFPQAGIAALGAAALSLLGLHPAQAQVTLTANDSFGASSFNTGMNWSDHNAPSSASDYIVGTGGGLTLRTPSDGTTNPTFGGKSLTINGSSDILVYKGPGSDTLTVNNLTLTNGGTVGNGQGNTFTLAGTNMTLGTGGGVFETEGAGRGIIVSAAVGGAGSLTASNNITGAAGAGTVILTGTNTYTGGTILAAASTVAGNTLTLQIGNGGTTGTLGTGGVTTAANTILAFDLSNNYSVSNVISGAGSLTQIGTGITTLTGANTYTGTTMIKSGSLEFAKTQALSSGAVSVASGGTLVLGVGGTGDFSNATTGTGSIGGTFSGATFASGSAYGLDTTDGSTSYAGVLSGAGVGLTKLGANTLTLTGANTYTGGTTVTAGTLVVGNGGGNAYSSSYTLGGGTLDLGANGAFSFNGPLNLTADSTFGNTSGGQINTSGTITGNGHALTINNGTNTSAFYLNSTITNVSQINVSQGALGFQLGSGQGSSPINVASGATFQTYGGGTLANNLTLNGVGVGGVGALYNQGNGSTIFTGTVALASTSTINTGGGTNNISLNGVVSGVGGLTKTSTSMLTLSAADTYTGATTISAGTLQLGTGTSGQDGSLTTSGIADNAALAYNIVGSQTPGYVVTGTGTLTKSGAGSLTFSGANTYTGATTVSGGTLALQNKYSSTALSISSGAVLELNVASGQQIDDPTSTFSGLGTLRKTGTGTQIWQQGTATFNLSAGSTIDVEGGTFIGGSYGNENWTGNKSSLNIASGATFNGVEASTNFDALTGAGTLEGGYNGATPTTIGVANGTGTFTGSIQDSGQNNGTLTLKKAGTGTETLSGANTYTGGTTITGGTLALSHSAADGTGALAVGSATTVQTGVNNALGGGNVTITAATIQNTDLTANDPTPTVSHPNVSNDKQTSGTLTLGNGVNILDFGAGNTGAIFDFANSSLASWTGTLSVYDYSGLYPSGSNAATSMYTTGGGGLDQLFFGTDSTGLTAAQLGDITFYSDNGKTLYPGGSAVILSDGEVVAAPEPSAWAGLGLTAFGIGGLVLKARKRKQTEMAA